MKQSNLLNAQFARRLFQNGIFELAIIGCYVDCLYECGCWFQTVCAI